MSLSFKNREEAACLLAGKLAEYRGKNPLILAIPRGAVPMGYVLAKQLQGELDVVLVRKLRAPHQPEFAMGAVDEDGHVYLNPQAKELNISKFYLEQEKEEQLQTLRRRRNNYTPNRSSLNPKGRVVILVDDGVATGSTMISAIQTVRMKNPSQIVVATAVSPPDTIRRLKEFADKIVCLEVPDDFSAVGQFFKDFSQVPDEEVIALLNPHQ